jgi:hypothetical protein
VDDFTQDFDPDFDEREAGAFSAGAGALRQLHRQFHQRLDA